MAAPIATKAIIKQVLKAKGLSATFSVEEIDRGLGKIKTALRSIQLDKSYVKAGLLGKGSKRKGDPLTNVELGIIHEFGTQHVPARPFIRPAFEKHRKEYIELLRRLVAAKVYRGDMSYDRALGIIGAKMAADMKNYVTRGPQIPPPNAPAWAAEKAARGYWKWSKRAARAQKKGKAIKEGPIPPPRTLVDTGRMVGSITFGVVHRSSEDSK